MLPDVCILCTGRCLHGMLSCLQPWNRYISLNFQIVAPMEELDRTVLSDVCTLGTDDTMLSDVGTLGTDT
jgi:hypothetical protein